MALSLEAFNNPVSWSTGTKHNRPPSCSFYRMTFPSLCVAGHDPLILPTISRLVPAREDPNKSSNSISATLQHSAKGFQLLPTHHHLKLTSVDVLRHAQAGLFVLGRGQSRDMRQNAASLTMANPPAPFVPPPPPNFWRLCQANILLSSFRVDTQSLGVSAQCLPIGHKTLSCAGVRTRSMATIRHASDIHEDSGSSTSAEQIVSHSSARHPQQYTIH